MIQATMSGNTKWLPGGMNRDCLQTGNFPRRQFDICVTRAMTPDGLIRRRVAA